MTTKEEMFRLLEKFCSLVSVSGFEDEMRQAVVEELRTSADEVRIDSMGNVIALKKGGGEGKLMIAAHMDEIGLMIRGVDEKGFLRFVPVGGWSERILPGQRVLIKTEKGPIRGVIGSKPPHLRKPEEEKKVISMDELFIDVGASSRKEVEEMGITVGSVAVLDRAVVKLGSSDVVSGRAFDDKIGLAVMLEAFKEAGPKVDLYAVATVQEEVGLKGARTAAFSIGPDVALALDVTIAADVPGVEETKQVTKVGKGPAIKVMDGRGGSGLIAHPAVRRLLVEVATGEGIPYQLEVLPGGTTDASAIQLTREGIPAGAVSVPTRYVHSPVEVISLSDAVNSVKLVKAFAESLDRDWMSSNLSRTV